MAKSKQSKVEVVDRLSQELTNAKGIVFADFTGLLVKEMQELRAELRKAGIYYEVVKKSLLERSLKSAKFDNVSSKQITGSISVAVSSTDEVEPAKLIAGFAKGHEKMQLLGGILDGLFMDGARVKELAKLPGKQELRARLVGSLSSPMRGLASVLQGNLRGLVQVLKAKAEKS